MPLAQTVEDLRVDRQHPILDVGIGSLVLEPQACAFHHADAADAGILRVTIAGAGIGMWKDFASGQRGDIIDLIAKVKNMKPADVVKEARRYYFGEG
jgi:hypothetical protein